MKRAGSLGTLCGNPWEISLDMASTPRLARDSGWGGIEMTGQLSRAINTS